MSEWVMHPCLVCDEEGPHCVVYRAPSAQAAVLVECCHCGNQFSVVLDQTNS